MKTFEAKRTGRAFWLSIFALVVAIALSAPTFAQTDAAQNSVAQASATPVEQGKFILHKFEQPIGEETYEVTKDRESLGVKMDFKFTDRGTAVPMTASFRGAADLTPESFEIKGRNSRSTTIDDAVEIQAGKVRVRDRDKWTESSRPAQFFTIAGYAPATMQMLMVRYWATHGSPTQLATLPSGQVKIEPRGQDSVKIDGKDQTFDRFTIEGLIWGRETLWFDAGRNLIASVTTDAEFDHFEAIRDGYESGLGTFVGRAGADGMAALADISKGISGSRAQNIAIVGGTLVDGTGRAAIPDSVVLIENGRITAVGPVSQVKIPAGFQNIDARGKTVLPGLWDMHAHFEQVEWGPIYLAAGATTVRDVGNEFEFITAVRDAVAGGRGLGPRLLLAGVVDGTGPLALGVERVDTPEQAKAWVDKYHAADFQQIKIYSSVKLEEVKAVADEAHGLGMTVTGHVPEGLNAYQVIEAGQDQINHIGYIADIMRKPLAADAKRLERMKAAADIDLTSPEAQKAISFLREHHTVIDPTVALSEFYTATTAKPTASFEPGVAKIAPELAEQLTDVGPPSELTEMREQVFQKNLEIIGAL